MRVLCFGEEPDRSEITLLEELSRRGIEFLAVLDPASPAIASLPLAGVRTSAVSLRPFDPAARAALAQSLADWRPTIIHVLTSRALRCLFRVRLPRPRPRVVFYRGRVERPRLWIPAHVRKYLGRRVDCFFANCEAVAAALVAGGVAASRVHVVRKGHDASWYEAAEALDLRSQLDLGPETFLIGTVANARREKGVSYLVGAMERLARGGRQVRCVLAGLDKRSVIARRISPFERPGLVTAYGWCSNVPAFLRSLDVFVTPSLSEGLSRALIEAMFCKVPIVATAAGGTPELIHDGKTGLLVPPGDAAALARSIESLIDDAELRQRLAAAALAWVRSNLTIERAATATLAGYRRALEQSAARAPLRAQ